MKCIDNCHFIFYFPEDPPYTEDWEGEIKGKLMISGFFINISFALSILVSKLLADSDILIF